MNSIKNKIMVNTTERNFASWRSSTGDVSQNSVRASQDSRTSFQSLLSMDDTILNGVIELHDTENLEISTRLSQTDQFIEDEEINTGISQRYQVKDVKISTGISQRHRVIEDIDLSTGISQRDPVFNSPIPKKKRSNTDEVEKPGSMESGNLSVFNNSFLIAMSYDIGKKEIQKEDNSFYGLPIKIKAMFKKHKGIDELYREFFYLGLQFKLRKVI